MLRCDAGWRALRLTGSGRVGLLLSVGTLCRCTSQPRLESPAQRIVVTSDDSLPPAPRLRAFAASPALVGVVVSVDSIGSGWFVVNVKGVAASDTSVSRATLDRRRLSDTAWLPAEPGARYSIAVQLVTTTVPARASSWSGAITVTTWQDKSNNEYGFAIERAGADGVTFERVSLVQPNKTSWTYTGLAPGEPATFRVLSFNPAGVSAPSRPVTASSDADVARATSIEGDSEKPDTLAACLAADVDLSRPDEVTGGEQPRLYRALPFGAHTVDMRVYMCGNANCSVTLFAEYRGCKRAIGDLFFVPGDSSAPGWTVRATDPDGWPVLATTNHHSYASFGVYTYQLLRGRYRGVDGYTHCGAMRDVAYLGRRSDPSSDDANPQTIDVRRLRPPFGGCQLDDPGRR